ncbi:MAG TPA: lasso peptide biosynthesis PqqD family chaperone, partial [Pseudomonadales bacterium]|nr:lasso peptide biosynthesis PqqD family chaperone [Pseudomonadales bacterium]
LIQFDEKEYTMQTKEFSLNSVIQRNPTMLFTDFGEEKVMLSIEDGKYYGINPVGAQIWELLQTPQPLTQVVNAVCDHFDVSQSECETDVLSFVKHLIDKNMAFVC